MRKSLSLVLVLGLALLGLPGAAGAGPVRAPSLQGGTISGLAKDAKGQKLPNYKVRVRSVSTGKTVAETVSNEAGEITFTGLAPETYVVEIVNAAGEVIGLSPAIVLTAGATVTVTVTASAVGAIAAAAGGGFSLFGLGTLATVGVIGAAGALTFAGVVAAMRTVSPSR